MDDSNQRYNMFLLEQLAHPGIVTYLDSFEHDNALHLVMEFCDGGDLSEFIASKQHSDSS